MTKHRGMRARKRRESRQGAGDRIEQEKTAQKRSTARTAQRLDDEKAARDYARESRKRTGSIGSYSRW